jgi:D-3-phosphoglycerate dehydrogenase
MKIVVSDCDHASMSIEEKIFSDNGLSFTHLACRTEDDLIAQCAGFNIALNQYAPFTDRVLAALRPDLKQIVRYGVGVDNIDLAAAARHGVQVCNVPDYGMNEVSDHALGLMLALVRRIPFTTGLTRAGVWDYRRSIPVRRLGVLTVGVVGVGRIGRLFARKAAALGCRVLGYDPYRPDLKRELPGIESVDFDTLLRQSDIVSLHCPLTAETRGLFGAEALARMKPTALLINTARGGIIDEAALAEALAAERLGGAAIDTIEREPLPATSPLFCFDTCLITPHMAWYSEESADELNRKVAEEAVRFAKGEPVHYPVNRPVPVAD